MTLDRALIWAFAQKVFGSEAAARAWMIAPNWSLDNERPIDLLETEEGATEVRDSLGRIQDGTFS
jgi:putative toxin-antitoxin system antitoxin component (TIGR02293 family)